MKKLILLSALVLTACNSNGYKKDYDAALKCSDMGMKAGTAEYDACMHDEHAASMLEQQRKEYEQRKQYEDDARMRRSIGY